MIAKCISQSLTEEVRTRIGKEAKRDSLNCVAFLRLRRQASERADLFALF